MLSLSPDDQVRLSERAREAGLTPAALIQHWIELGPMPQPKGYAVARAREPEGMVPRWARRFVWTLHLVPGQPSGPPLAVRRRILDASDLAGLIETPGGRMSFDLDELETTGHARGDGYHRAENAGFAPGPSGMWGCDLALDIWDHPPTEEERQDWLRRRRAESAAARDMAKKGKGVMLVWVTFAADRAGAPDAAFRCRATRALGACIGDVKRGDLRVELPGYREPADGGRITHLQTVDFYRLAADGDVDLGNQGVDGAKRVSLAKPTEAQLRGRR